MKEGDLVTTCYGKKETVMRVCSPVVETYESAKRGEWYHVSKVRKAAEVAK